MKLGIRICAGVFVGFVCHSILIFLWGNSGIAQLRELKDYKVKLQENLSDLEVIHNELIAERDSLLQDGVEIELRARELGYRRPGEVSVNLPSDRSEDNTRTLGILIRRIDPERRNHLVLRVLAFITGIVAFGGSFLVRGHGNHTR